MTMTRDDIGQTILIRASEHIRQSGYYVGPDCHVDPDRHAAVMLLFDLQDRAAEGISAMFCCRPWSMVVADAHRYMESPVESLRGDPMKINFNRATKKPLKKPLGEIPPGRES